MTENLLDRLAEEDVPPVPTGLARAVHDRLNQRLLLVHLGDLLVRGMPYAAALFAGGVAALLGVTLSGRFPPEPNSEPPSEV